MPIALFASIVAERLAEAEREATISEVRQRTDALSKALDRQFQASFAALTALAESTEAQQGDLAGLYAHAQRFLARQSTGTSVGLADREGRILFVTRRPFGEPLAGVGPDDMSARVFASGKPQVSDLLQGTVTRDFLAVVHVPIRRDGEVIYDLRLGVRPASLAIVLAEQQFPPEWNAIIVDRKGTFVARTRAPHLVGQTAQEPLLRALANADRGILDLVTTDGEAVTATFQKVQASDWAVAIGVPHTILNAPSQRLRTIVALGGAAALFIGAAIAILLARHLSAQVCTAVTSAVALGRGSTPTPIRTDVRELAELNAALLQAHVLLRQREERLALAFEAARAAPWDYDVEADTLSWSPESYRLFGFGPENAPVTRAQWLSLLVPEDSERIRQQTSGGAWRDVVRLEYRIVHPESGVRWVAGMGKAVCDPTGALKRIVGINIDVTELKMAEQAMLEAKQEAEQANLAKSRFLASASHDMRQPVQSMMMFTSVLEQRLEGHEAAKAVVKHLDKAAMSLKTLLDGLLDISRLDAGIIVPVIADLALGPLFEELATEYGPQAAQKGLELRLVRTSLWLRTDPALLERILRNLIENAIKYTSVGRILVGCRRHGAGASLQIADTGMGIPQDQRRAIFNEFHQLGNPERDRAKGLGLGLSIVKRLATLLDHGIEVRSTLGRGSCFAVIVPRVAAPPHATAPISPQAFPAASRHIAVVIDDEEEVRAGLQLQLQAWGYEVVAGPDHHAVLPALNGQLPDLVIADYRLRGGLTGIAVLRELEQTFRGPVRGFLLTGDTAPERIAEAKRSGYEVLHKPVTAAMLGDRLSRW